MMQPSDRRLRPVPSPTERVYPNSFGPSSTIRPSAPSTAPGAFLYSTRIGAQEPGATQRLNLPASRKLAVLSSRPGQPVFDKHTSYSPPYSPQALPTGARPSFYQPLTSSPFTSATTAYPSPPTKVPLSNSSSILVHSGFWQILQATGSRFLSTSVLAPKSPSAEDLSGLAPEAPLTTSTATPVQAQGLARKKRISVDMISNPGQFAHLVHASNVEQAENILRRWQADGVGKLGQTTWAEQIKAASRARARARGIAEVQSARVDDKGVLQVVNGLPSLISEGESVEAVEDMEREGPQDALPTPRPRFSEMTNQVGTTQGMEGASQFGSVRVNTSNSTSLETQLDVDDVLDKGNTGEWGVSKSFMPSLMTIEKAVATKVFFETHYHAILKKPHGRDQRRALLERELTRLNISDAERRNVRSAWALSETDYLRDMRKKVGIGSFEKLKIIGHGAFGVVSLVRERGTGELYAMKQLRKADMLNKGQEGHVRAERDLLASAAYSTEWTVRLVYSFQDTDYLYLVTSYYQGGDLLTLLIEKDVFPEDFAKFYFSEMVLCVEETHKVLGAIHRDIKPDNFLFSASGHIAISDFGLATDFHWAHDGAYFEHQRLALLRKHGIDVTDGKLAPTTQRFDDGDGQEEDTPGSILTWRDRHRRRLAYSVVGTNNYMDVHVLRGNGYKQECDWWSLGVILFEMLYGYPPFVSKSRQQTRQKILNWKAHLRFPPKPRVSREAQDLILSLICEREDRLGSRVGASSSRPNSILLKERRSAYLGNFDGANEIKAHPWFRGIDFSNLRKQRPPFVPQVKGPADTKYFEDNIPDAPLPAPAPGPGAASQSVTKDPMLGDRIHGAELLKIRKQLAFQGWTYKAPKNPVFDPQTGINLGRGKGKRPTFPVPEERGRSPVRSEGGSGFGRSLSI